MVSQAKGGCKTESCGKSAYSLGYCQKHYTRLRRHGDTTTKLTPVLRTKRHKHIESIKDKILSDYSEGGTTVEIAAKYEISDNAVARVVNEAGIMRSLSEGKRAVRNPMWKGDEVITYTSLHSWVRRHKETDGLCEYCGEDKPLDLANIRPSYSVDTYTRELANWLWLCRRCHMIQNGRLEKLGSLRG